MPDTRRTWWEAVFLVVMLVALATAAARAGEDDPVFQAVLGGDLDAVRATVAADPSVVHAKGLYGLTPLHFAAAGGELKIVTFLVDHGADVNARGNPGTNWTPLAYLAKRPSGKAEIAAFLLDRGADVNATLADGTTALHWAASGDNVEVARLLLARGANVNARTSARLTPLQYAGPDVAVLLRRHGAE